MPEENNWLLLAKSFINVELKTELLYEWQLTI